MFCAITIFARSLGLAFTWLIDVLAGLPQLEPVSLAVAFGANKQIETAAVSELDKHPGRGLAT